MIPETQPGFSLKKETSLKMPIGLFAVALSFTAGAAIWVANLSRDVGDLRRDLAEAQRVNVAQDKRFENLESSVSELPVLRGDLRRLEREHKP